MGFDVDCVVDAASVPAELFCPVCRQFLSPGDAQRSACGHVFCQPCVAYLVQACLDCPRDGHPLKRQHVQALRRSDPRLYGLLVKAHVRCLFHRSGCSWHGDVTACEEHIPTCMYGSYPVECNRCKMQMSHRDIQEHARNCNPSDEAPARFREDYYEKQQWKYTIQPVYPQHWPRAPEMMNETVPVQMVHQPGPQLPAVLAPGIPRIPVHAGSPARSADLHFRLPAEPPRPSSRHSSPRDKPSGHERHQDLQKRPRRKRASRRDSDRHHTTSRKRNSDGWCRICHIDCFTFDGLKQHSQCRDHQEQALQLVFDIQSRS